MNKVLMLIVTETGALNDTTQAYIKAIFRKAKEMDIYVIGKIVNSQKMLDAVVRITNHPVLILEPCEFKKPENYNNAEKNCTANVIVEYCVNNFKENKNILIINRSELIGRPLINILLDNDFTVSVAHSKTHLQQLQTLCAINDIVVVATGQDIHLDLTDKIVFDLANNYKGKSKIHIDMRTIGKLTTEYMLSHLYEDEKSDGHSKEYYKIQEKLNNSPDYVKETYNNCFATSEHAKKVPLKNDKE